MKHKPRDLTPGHIRRYADYLREQERAPATIQKYVHDLTALLGWLGGAPVTKAALIAWKEELTAAHAPATVNSMLAAVNGFLNWMGWRECAVRLLKIQRPLFCDAGRELSKAEYARLVAAAKREGNRRLSLPVATTRPPIREHATAIARPIPDEAPVIKTVLPSNEKGL